MSEVIDKQVLYLGRWVSREHFAAFIYRKDEQKLVKNYNEFADLIASGVWFAEKKDILESSRESNVVDIKPKRGRKCRSQQSQ